MSLFHRRAYPGQTAAELIPRRPETRTGTVSVTNETALRHSAVWACLRLRANLVSTLPIDVYRRVLGAQIEVPKPPVLVSPGGERVGMLEWMYSTQFDLDRAGNTFGLITARDGLGLPSRIDLVPLAEVSVIIRKGELAAYRIAGTEYDPGEVWHERQYTVAGLHVGLSPVAYAAWAIGEYLSIQEFALDWFGGGAIPAAHLKNTEQILTPEKSDAIKKRFKASVANGDVFVTGSDWEYQMLQAETAGSAWIEAKQFGVADVARFFDCPGDLIDAVVSSKSITYASITQRHLDFLVMHLGPTVTRREDALNRLTPRPRYVKLNTDALLRMDPQTRAAVLRTQIESRTLAPSEARELENRPPFTEAQLAEFDRLFGQPNKQPAATTATPSGGSL
ncbi:portal protein [Sphaerisporangium siamense]|uniref:HK97 family phage portal protein n=1 Tax=Sphaerisporangium siamense TaxID=795645 RepID=A0A7W7D4R6_9ACTN|nr:phage portal protein [Sphaerisporangium siamense]MBB4699305.1 HK97 family phage portal protein [Sphaerisporangium siamense]GII89635.1 portal protein [Sphaerisporangium siamense]